MVKGLLFPCTSKKVRICIKARTNGSLFGLFYGVIEDLGFDHGLWNWKGWRELMSYNAREGQKLLHPKEILSRNVSEKWNQVLSPNSKLKGEMFGPREGTKRRQVPFGLCGTRPLL
jgi:hypothetical protein